jgi:hypothetical protein
MGIDMSKHLFYNKIKQKNIDNKLDIIDHPIFQRS